jgi:hypothetical protein
MLDARGIPTVQDRVARAIALGGIDTVDDARVAESIAQEERNSALRPAIDHAVAEVESLGGTNTFTCTSLPCFQANVPAGSLDTIASIDSVVLLDYLYPSEDETNDMHGVGYRQMYQTTEYVDLGHDGNNIFGASNIHTVVAENDGPMHTHPAFRDANTSATRIAGMYDCNSSGACVSLPSGWPVNQRDAHATEMNALAFADLTDGQDASVPNAVDRERRSFGAREARMYMYEFSTTTIAAGLSHIPTHFIRPELVSFSQGNDALDPLCEGMDAASQAADYFYENSFLALRDFEWAA